MLAALIAIPVLGEIPDAAAMIGIILATLGVVLASGIVGTEPASGRSVEDAQVSQARERAMFFFFSNRLGCAGSLLISAVLTLIVLALMGVF